MNDNSKLYLIRKFDYVLGLSLDEFIKNNKHEEQSVDDDLRKYVEEKIEQRKQAKLNLNDLLNQHQKSPI